MCEIITKHSLNTDFPACSVEFNRENIEIFAVGLYELEKKDELVSSNNSRRGKVEIFNYCDEKLEKLQSVDTDAILDQKWIKNHLLTATSEGFIENFKLDIESKKIEKVSRVKLQKDEPDCLALSLDVHNGVIAASDSKGKISLLNLEQNSLTTQWKAHDFEAWTVALDRFNDNVIYSGNCYETVSL